MGFKWIGGAAAIAIAAWAAPCFAEQSTSSAEPSAIKGDGQSANADVVAQLASKYSLTPAAVRADGCELHVWPAARMTSMTAGLLGGGLIDAALHGGTDANNKTMMASALDSPSQLEALLRLDLRKELSRTPGTTIVPHPEPLDGSTLDKVKGRRSESQSKCYSELIVTAVFYYKSAYTGRALRTNFEFRDFGNGQKPILKYAARGEEGLKLFPPKEGEDATAALDELVATYQSDFKEYANNARKKFATESSG